MERTGPKVEKVCERREGRVKNERKEKKTKTLNPIK